VGKYDSLFDADPPAPAAAPAPAPAAAPAGKYAALFDETPDHAAPIDQPAGIGLSGPGSKDTDATKLAPTETAPRMVASESKVPGHQGEPERADSVVPELLSVLDGAKSGTKSLYGGLNDAGNMMAEVGVGAAKRIAANPLAGPGEAFQDTLADPRFQRQAMRGVNNAVMPFVGNKLAAAAGGPPEHSEEDAAAFPRAEALGGLAGALVPVPYGEIAAAAVKPAKAAAKGLLGAVEKAGASAQERRVARAVEDIEEGATKKARAGMEKSEDKVEALARENPEIVEHARDNAALSKDAQEIRKRASSQLSDLYAAKDAEAAAEPLPAGLFGKDAPAPRAPGVRISEPVANMDASIAKLEKGDPTERLAAKELKRIRDELAEAKGPDSIIPARELRDEQSARQTIGYAKAVPGMPDYEVTNAKILANRQASRDIGDSIVKHVTGMDYEAAKAAAAADPSSVAGRLFKLNGEIEGASRIEAAIASKKGRTHGGMSDFIHFLFSHHGKRSGALGTAALAAHELGLHKTAGVLGTAASAVAAAPTVARYADNAIAAAGRGAAKLSPKAVSEVIDLAAAPASTFQDIAEAAAKRGLSFEVARRIAREAGKAAGAPPVGPLFAEQQQEASP